MAVDEDEGLPTLPGFREMALRRRRMVADLAGQRRAAGLSQTEVAARMGTSQSTVARLEAGEVDPRLSTLERYAEAVDRRLDWRLSTPEQAPGDDGANTRKHDG
jgi:transcriptional regulator with XRE-family HTH domain